MGWNKILKKSLFGLLLLWIIVFIFSILIFNLSKNKTQESKSNPQETKTYNLGTYQEVDTSMGSLVTGFPEIPTYPQSKLLESKSYNEDGGMGYLAKYQTNDRLSTIFTGFRQKLVNDGWKVSTEPDSLEGAKSFLLEVVKDKESPENNILLSITGVQESDESVNITVTYHKGMGEYGKEE